jgi:hypothetical protein
MPRRILIVAVQVSLTACQQQHECSMAAAVAVAAAADNACRHDTSPSHFTAMALQLSEQASCVLEITRELPYTDATAGRQATAPGTGTGRLACNAALVKPVLHDPVVVAFHARSVLVVQRLQRTGRISKCAHSIVASCDALGWHVSAS